MPASFDKKGVRTPALPVRPVVDATTPATGAPQSPDAALSAAFRSVLGRQTSQDHLRDAPKLGAQGIARSAKSERPGATGKGTPRKAHIGPRSGHK